MENATRIRQYVQWQSRHYFVFPLEWKNARKEKKNLAIDNWNFTTDKS